VRCLIVDDNRQFLCAARALLERDGIAVVAVATDSAQALRLIADILPDVALIDINLGDENGVDLINTITGSGLADDMLVIGISTYAEEDLMDLDLAMPGAAFLAKNYLCGKAIREVIRKKLLAAPMETE
jgi:CheY-like chemotaxis protein